MIMHEVPLFYILNIYHKQVKEEEEIVKEGFTVLIIRVIRYW